MAHRARLSRIKTGDWAWPLRGPRVERVSPSRHLMHCSVCFLGGRKGRFSPLTSALRHDRRNACPSRRLPAAGRFQSAPSATYRIQLRQYALKSRRISPPNSSDAHVAPNLDQIKNIDDMFDAVGLTLPARHLSRWPAYRLVGLDRVGDDGELGLLLRSFDTALERICPQHQRAK